MSDAVSTDTTYNGWKNYETWGVALILDNDQGTHELVRERTREIIAEAPENENVPEIWPVDRAARYLLSDWLKDFTETLCGIGSESEDYGIEQPSLMAQQLLGGAISDVDFYEIAAHYIEDES